jgi:hypothetical protein
MKTLLIITGPQGSGNHLWSKIFAATPSVFGWQALLNEYWIAHDQEPFAEAWHDPVKLTDVEFNQYAVTSISCPYAYHGTTTVPDYQAFINRAKGLGYDVKIAIIGRDQNVLQYQQTRVRGTASTDHFRTWLPWLCLHDPVFLSTELLYLYGQDYLRTLRRQLKFPIYIEQAQLDEILKQDPNSKYFTAAAEQPLDQYVRTVSGLNTR